MKSDYLPASTIHMSSVNYNNRAFREAFFDDTFKEFCIVTDFAEGGDLFELIKQC